MSETKIKLKCTYCKKEFYRTLRCNSTASKKGLKPFCSKECHNKNQTIKIKIICETCGKDFYILPRFIKQSKSGKNFCSRSCSVTYHNTHKTTGYRRSKLEIYLEEQLTILYPNLEILFNNKSTINSELDIYVPSLHLAFELNGIFHYEPIFGNEILNKTKNNDHRKFLACIENQIDLCVIDTSLQKHFTVKSSQKYLDIIIKIIEQKLAVGTGVAPAEL